MSDWSPLVKKYICHLGKGVDASVTVDEIWGTLYDDCQHRMAVEVSSDYSNVKENIAGMKFQKKLIQKVDNMKLKWNVAAKASLNLLQFFPCSLGGNLGFSTDHTNTLKALFAEVETRTFSISSNVGNVYERDLSTYILSKVKMTGGADPCTILDQYMAKVGFQSHEMKLIAKYCKSFFEERPITHYIKRIDLGATMAVKETKDSLKQTASAKVEFQDSASAIIDAIIEGTYKCEANQYLFEVKSLGTISKDRDVQKDTEHEVIINAAIEPVLELIRNKILRTIVGEILDEHMYYKCKAAIVDPVLVSGKVGDIEAYLMVKEDELCTTTDKEEASSFILNLPDPTNEQCFNMFQGERRVMVPAMEWGVDLLPLVDPFIWVAKRILQKYLLDSPPVKVLDRGDHNTSIFTLEMPFAGDSSSVSIHKWKTTSYFIKNEGDFIRSSHYVYLKKEGREIKVACTESSLMATRFSITRKNRSLIDFNQEFHGVEECASCLKGSFGGMAHQKVGALAHQQVAMPLLGGASAAKPPYPANYVGYSFDTAALNPTLTFSDIVGEDFISSEYEED